MHPRITIIALLSLLSLSLALPVSEDAVEARFDDSIPSMAPNGDDPVEFKNPA
ncbi:MAG: hypothetical protein M1839_002314 [Geoglossum umbratile]|nr:MAG: hypothetical protein M1839_002314 [Geoglossum umbratile]